MPGMCDSGSQSVRGRRRKLLKGKTPGYLKTFRVTGLRADDQAERPTEALNLKKIPKMNSPLKGIGLTSLVLVEKRVVMVNGNTADVHCTYGPERKVTKVE